MGQFGKQIEVLLVLLASSGVSRVGWEESSRVVESRQRVGRAEETEKRTGNVRYMFGRRCDDNTRRETPSDDLTSFPPR